MKPHIRLTAEKVTSVTIGFTSILSASHPTKNAMPPINSTYIAYRIVVASDLNVHFALTKNEMVTAMQKATTLESDCEEPPSSMSAKTAQ